MIPIIELRINNLVYFKGLTIKHSSGCADTFNPGILPIASLHFDRTLRLQKKNPNDDTIGCFHEKYIDPIPLNKELLLKAGFLEKGNSDGIGMIKDYIYISSVFGRFSYSYNGTFIICLALIKYNYHD